MKIKFTLQECDKLADLGFTVAKGRNKTEPFKRGNMIFYVTIENGILYLLTCILGPFDTPFIQTWKQPGFLNLLNVLDSYDIR